MTTTAYITFMDQDDCCGPDYLKAYAAAMRDEDADIVCDGCERRDESGKCQDDQAAGEKIKLCMHLSFQEH